MGRFPRVPHPCATFRRPEGRLHVRLACVKPAASVRSEPGSNSQIEGSDRTPTRRSAGPAGPGASTKPTQDSSRGRRKRPGWTHRRGPTRSWLRDRARASHRRRRTAAHGSLPVLQCQTAATRRRAARPSPPRGREGVPYTEGPRGVSTGLCEKNSATDVGGAATRPEAPASSAVRAHAGGTPALPGTAILILAQSDAAGRSQPPLGAPASRRHLRSCALRARAGETPALLGRHVHSQNENRCPGKAGFAPRRAAL